jgi:hypothetical protein
MLLPFVRAIGHDAELVNLKTILPGIFPAPVTESREAISRTVSDDLTAPFTTAALNQPISYLTHPVPLGPQ